MNRLKLTKTAVEKLKFPAGATTKTGKPLTQIIFWDTDLPGFGVRMTANSVTKTYVLQQRVKGSRQERNISLGRHGEPTFRVGDTARTYPFGVEDARAKALTLLAQMLSGVDPVEAEKQRQEEARRKAALDEAQSISLRAIMEDYLANHHTKHGPLRPRSKKDIRDNMERYLASWLDKPIATITRDRCLAKFTEISNHAPTAANSTMRWLRALCNHAREKYGTDEGYPILAVNPVTRMFKLRKPNAEEVRKDRIPLDKVGAVWLMLRRRAATARNVLEATAADWVSLMLLTGWRRTESGGLKWADVDLDAKTITLRRDVVKNHNEVTFPMSTVLHDILEARKLATVDEKLLRRRRRNIRADTFVFAGNGKKCPFMTDARATLDAVSEVAGLHVSPHSLRRTAEDIAKAVKVDADERRQLLNHLASDVHGAHYSNDPNPETLRPAVEAMAKFVTDAAKVAEAQESGANVVPLSAKKG